MKVDGTEVVLVSRALSTRSGRLLARASARSTRGQGNQPGIMGYRQGAEENGEWAEREARVVWGWEGGGGEETPGSLGMIVGR